MGIIEKIFGTHSEHELKRIYPIVDHIDALEPEMQKLSCIYTAGILKCTDRRRGAYCNSQRLSGKA